MTFRLFFAVVFLIVAVIGIVVGNRKVNVEGDEYNTHARTIGFVALGLFVFFGLLSCLRMVSPGEVGIPVVFGKTKAPIAAGIHFTNPFADVAKMSVRTENYTMSGTSNEGAVQGNDAVAALGSDGGNAEVESTVLFHLNISDAGNVYKDVGTNYVDKILRPAARSCIRDQFGHDPMVVEATTGRDKVATDIQTCIEGRLGGRGLTLESFQLRDVKLAPDLQNAILAKVNAQQASEQQAFELTKTQQQAEIARVDAQGRADSQQIIACGGSTVTEADGLTHVIPKAGDSCQNTLTPEYLQYLYIQSLKDVAASPNHSTIIVPFDQNLTPLINANG